MNVTLAIHGVELFPVRGLASPGGTVGSPGRTLSPDVATDDSRSSLSSSASPRTVSPSHNMLDFSTNPNPTLPSPSMLSFLNLNMESAARNSSSGLVLGSPPLAALHTMTEMKTQALLHPQVCFFIYSSVFRHEKHLNGLLSPQIRPIFLPTENYFLAMVNIVIISSSVVGVISSVSSVYMLAYAVHSLCYKFINYVKLTR